MTAVEAIAALTLSAALAVAVVQAASSSARVRANLERRSAGLLAAGNALELLRAADPGELEVVAEQLRSGPVAGLPEGRIEVALDAASIGGVAAREITVRVFDQRGNAPVTLVGWHVGDPADANDAEAGTDPATTEEGDGDA